MDTSWRRNYLRYKSFFLNMMTQYRERADWKAYLEILLSLATVSVFSIFALRPTILTIAELIRQIEEKKDTVARMDEKIGSLSKAQTLFDRESANISLLINNSVPTKAHSDIFARQIEGLASKYQINISRVALGEAQIIGDKISPEVQPDPSATGSSTVDTQKIKFSVTATANFTQYPELVNFLREFENLQTAAKTDILNVSAKEDNDSKEKTLVLFLEGNLPYLMTK